MWGLRKLVESKLVASLKNKYRPHPHAALCVAESHLCTVKFVGHENKLRFYRKCDQIDIATNCHSTNCRSPHENTHS